MTQGPNIINKENSENDLFGISRKVVPHVANLKSDI
jgi:hypothetical protein